MLIKDIQRGYYSTTRDNTVLCELLHPSNEDVKIAYSIAHAFLKPGCASRSHRLKESSEVYYILEGEGTMHIDDESASVHQGQAVFIPPGSWQHIQNTGTTDLKFLCIVYPKWDLDDEDVRDEGI